MHIPSNTITERERADMKFLGAIIAGFLALGLAGCSGTQLQEAQMSKATGDAFSSSLHHYYIKASEHEYGYGNYESSDYFADKANKGKSLKDAAAAWNEIRKGRGDLRYKSIKKK